jgi:hypothetical protein
MRRARTPGAQPLPRDEVIARAVEARRARPVTAAESRARFALVERLLVADTSHAAMVRLCRETFPGMSESAVERQKTRVLAQWAEQDAERSYIRKAQMRRRMLRLIARATKAGEWRAVIAAETLLAKVDGLIAPERVQVDVNGLADPVNAALVRVMGGMSAEERERLIREYEELEARAASAVH